MTWTKTIDQLPGPGQLVQLRYINGDVEIRRKGYCHTWKGSLYLSHWHAPPDANGTMMTLNTPVEWRAL